MRITILLGPFLSPPPGPTGAVEMVWSSIADALTKRGHTVTLVCRRPTQVNPPSAESKVNYIYVRGYRRTGQIFLDLILDLLFSARALAAAPSSDTAVLNSFFSPVLLYLKRRDLGAVFYGLARYPKKQFALYGRLFGVFAVSNAVARALVRQSPKFARRVTVVPNPIDTNAFRFESLPAGPSRDGHLVLYTGRLHPEKGLLLLVQACSKLSRELPNVTLRLVGDRDVALGGGGEAFVSALANEAGDTLQLEVLDAVRGREQLAALLRTCDAYCYPSLAERGESFGVAPLEAMSVGCTVVLSDLECFGEFASPGVNALIFDHRSERKAENLQVALRQALTDRAGAERLGFAAATRARAFSIDAVAEQYETAFRSAVSGSSN